MFLLINQVDDRHFRLLVVWAVGALWGIAGLVGKPAAGVRGFSSLTMTPADQPQLLILINRCTTRVSKKKICKIE